ncbi:threonine synthase [Devosia sp. 63-57]|uniref:threonine synthase n=1 Tax=Devosia sp. 63-57 TaxID=1895751 RepID=UPI00086F8A39|nr:threonine synthase [Devosia sp. 63-57]ODT47549.1 MAG: threonine synthase [Pelagibacterium sp. SCN 63-126]ODU86360.1 MAG: threonine synthase [Pelagibacterium sp. SCN 63-17]OJX42743.1 MAG: threonine synthase [Devosia sp. 63-57]
MQFVSTRGKAPALGFSDAVLAGLAADGGLYVPASWPQVSADEVAGFAGKPYADVAFAIISRFTQGEIDDATLKTIIDEAYASFRHASVTPLVEIAPGHFVLELFHGPTLAFKDVAMQFLSRVMDHILAQRGLRATIVGATSGDTGSAAIEAFRGRDTTDIFILHPKGRTSEVQRRQMTTVLDANVHNIALEGTFDDCQDLVKAMFNNHGFRDRVRLSGVNSINWGRIVAQIVYYFTAAASLGAPHRKVSFTVPTGNFGDIFAGYCAKQMGLPIEQLVIATNANDILRRTIDTGRYEMAGVEPTISPSMDIQISSNFERLLFESAGRDSDAVNRMMSSLKQSRGFALPDAALSAIRRDFAAGTTDEAATRAVIAGTWKKSGYLLDPHTAVGLGVAQRLPSTAVPMVTLGTAHPAKFPAAVKEASGVDAALPSWLADLYTREERVTVLANDQRMIEDFIGARSRAA